MVLISDEEVFSSGKIDGISTSNSDKGWDNEDGETHAEILVVCSTRFESIVEGLDRC